MLIQLSRIQLLAEDDGGIGRKVPDSDKVCFLHLEKSN